MAIQFQDISDQFLIVPDADALAEATAKILAEALRAILAEKPRAYFIPSSGRTPIKTYQTLVENYRDALDWSRVTAVQMDEYWSETLDVSLFFDRFLRHNVVNPLQLGGYVSMHKSRGEGMYCPDEYAQRLAAIGSIDLALHGIGRNGHIGFNEPDSREDSRTRLVRLADDTRIDNFPHLLGRETPRFGLTMGLEDLRAVKHSILIASGAHKASAIQGLLAQSPVADVPASILWDSEDFGLILDREAAAFVADSLEFYGPDQLNLRTG